MAAAVTADRTIIGPLLPAIALYTLATRLHLAGHRRRGVAVIAAYGAGAVAARARRNSSRRR